MTGVRCAIAFIATACCLCASTAHAFEPGRYGSVKLAEPTGEARGVVIYFSGRKGLSKTDDTAAQAIAKGGALVAEVDSNKYLRGLDKLKEKCHWLVYDTELLTRQLERERRLPTYLTPIVAGIGEGGTLAELNLVQAPAVTIAGPCRSIPRRLSRAGDQFVPTCPRERADVDLAMVLRKNCPASG